MVDIKRYDVVTIPGGAVGRVESLNPFVVATAYGLVHDLKPEDVIRKGVRIGSLARKKSYEDYLLERFEAAMPGWTFSVHAVSATTVRFEATDGMVRLETIVAKSMINSDQLIADWRCHARI